MTTIDGLSGNAGAGTAPAIGSAGVFTQADTGAMSR